MSKKRVCVFVKTMITFESDLSVDEALKEFSNSSTVKFTDTPNSKIIDTNWLETTGISYVETSADGAHSILKPIKDNDVKY